MAASILLLPSPLLPTTAYEKLQAALVRAGREARIAPAGLSGDEAAGDLVRRWAAMLEGDAVLVAHSNAGYLAPSVRAIGGAVDATIVFMDAALPPADGSAPLAPEPLREHLRSLADPDGLLPPWTRWWPRAELAAIVPAPELGRLDRECPRLPVGYFDALVTAPPGWVRARNRYLAFGATYADELDLAVRHGWPHHRLAGGHLHFMVDPAGVAREVLGLL